MEAERDGLKDLPLEGEWLTYFKKYHNLKELDRVVLAELVEIIEVHEDKRLTIHFKYADQIKRVCDYLEARKLSVSADSEEVIDNGTEK